jgi:hypothetical protein
MSFAGRNYPHPCQEQWERVLRWQDRLRKAEGGGPDDVVDIAFALFVCVHHMWNWVLATDPALRPSASRLLRESRELQLVRDLANGSKHHSLNDPSVDANHFTALEYIPPPRPVGSPTHRLVLCAGGEKHELLPLAWQAVEAWGSFLSREGLLIR